MLNCTFRSSSPSIPLIGNGRLIYMILSIYCFIIINLLFSVNCFSCAQSAHTYLSFEYETIQYPAICAELYGIRAIPKIACMSISNYWQFFLLFYFLFMKYNWFIITIAHYQYNFIFCAILKCHKCTRWISNFKYVAIKELKEMWFLGVNPIMLQLVKMFIYYSFDLYPIDMYLHT